MQNGFQTFKHLIFVDNLNQPAISDTDLHHLVHVKRLNKNEKFVISDGAGNFKYAWFTQESRNAIRKNSSLVEEIHIDEKIFNCRNRPIGTLLVGMAKPERIRIAIEKVTEIGIKKVILFKADRSNIGKRNIELALTKFKVVAKEAAKQARRPYLLELEGTNNLKDALLNVLNSNSDKCNIFVANPNGTFGVRRRYGVAIVGPPGGFSPTEEEFLANFDQVYLSPFNLRTETAAILASTLLMSN